MASQIATQSRNRPALCAESNDLLFPNRPEDPHAFNDHLSKQATNKRGIYHSYHASSALFVPSSNKP